MLNHSHTVPLLKKIHKYFKNFLRQLGTKVMGDELIILKDFLVFVDFS